MNIKSLCIAIAACLLAQVSVAQGSVKGKIKGITSAKKEENLAFANIYWIGTTVGTISDANGSFSISHPKGATHLVAKTIGYTSDTLAIKPGMAEVEFVLKAENLKLDEVVIAGRQRGSTMLAISPLKTEVITASGLCKMACCNLAESFENTASVSVGYSDAVSGARQIKMLGLAGTYTQMLDENRPVMRGIAAPYGLTYTPGQWLESIQVSKGPGTVINGYEAITGQINVEHRKPTAQEPLFINLFLGSDLRTEANIASALQLNDKLSTIILAHGSVDPMAADHNDDGFKDLPTAKQVNFANRWLYMADNGIQLRAGVKVLAEERQGGQMNDAPVTSVLGRYKSNINNKQANAYFKFGMPIGKKHNHAESGCTEDHDHSTHETPVKNEHVHGPECNHEKETKEHVHGPECNHEKETKKHVHGPECNHEKEVKEHEHGPECNHDAEKKQLHMHGNTACTGDHSAEEDHTAEECTAIEHSLAFVGDYNYHVQDSYFGIKNYDANMHSGFINLMYQGGFNKQNRLTAGTSFRFDKYDELLVDRYVNPASSKPIGEDIAERITNLDRIERVFGVFGEYTYSKDDKLSVILGARIDHNSLYGWLFTPRANFKWDITETFTVRASGGRGFRSPNPLSDNTGILATGRQIAINDKLKIEDAWTYGASVVKYFKLFNDERASFSVDAFRTHFNNQLLVDQEVNPLFVSIYNLDGKSYTNSIQADFNVTPIERFSIFLTYRYTDAKVNLKSQGIVEKPLVDRFKALVNLQYATKMNKWTFDFTAQLNGQTRLPNLDGNLNEPFEYSPIYPMFFGQITRKFRYVDVYVGCENIGNYTQKNPIIGADSPFSTTFNSSSVWGPLMGRKGYIGLRFTL